MKTWFRAVRTTHCCYFFFQFSQRKWPVRRTQKTRQPLSFRACTTWPPRSFRKADDCDGLTSYSVALLELDFTQALPKESRSMFKIWFPEHNHNYFLSPLKPILKQIIATFYDVRSNLGFFSIAIVFLWVFFVNFTHILLIPFTWCLNNFDNIKGFRYRIMQAQGGSTGVAILISNLGPRWGCVVHAKPLKISPCKWWLDGPQGLSGSVPPRVRAPSRAFSSLSLYRLICSSLNLGFMVGWVAVIFHTTGKSSRRQTCYNISKSFEVRIILYMESTHKRVKKLRCCLQV